MMHTEPDGALNRVAVSPPSTARAAGPVAPYPGPQQLALSWSWEEQRNSRATLQAVPHPSAVPLGVTLPHHDPESL